MKIELFRLKTKTFFTNTLLQINNREIIISNCDISKSNEAFFGKSDYEYYLTIEKETLKALIKGETDQNFIDFFEKFPKDLNLFKSIRQKLDENDIQYKFHTW